MCAIIRILPYALLFSISVSTYDGLYLHILFFFKGYCQQACSMKVSRKSFLIPLIFPECLETNEYSSSTCEYGKNIACKSSNCSFPIFVKTSRRSSSGATITYFVFKYSAAFLNCNIRLKPLVTPVVCSTSKANGKPPLKYIQSICFATFTASAYPEITFSLLRSFTINGYSVIRLPL